MSLLSNVSTTSGRILVVDDDAGARDLIVSSLRADGHDVDVSSDGIEALRLLGREWYDLIVSNLRMPELDGPSLYTAVTQRWPAQPPPLLFLAGLGGTSDYDGFLKVIRVYTKQPGKPADMKSPFTCPIGSTIVEMAALVHRDFADKLKSARIWGTGVHDGQAVGREHVLHDKDVVELHI